MAQETKENEIRIFFSWQSDDDFSQREIRAALRDACSRIEAQPSKTDARLVVEEATTRVPGSPNIPDEIRRKIEEADIFVCDISTVNRSAEGVSRPTPNPNVVFELGYAVAHLGWNRIIMLFNKAVGDFDKDPPFDFDRHRISPFQLDGATVKTDKQGKSDLRSLLACAVELVIDTDPKRPADMRHLSPEELRRKRDIDNLNRILAAIHWPSIDEHVRNLPNNIAQDLFYYWAGFDGIYVSSIFHINDVQLAEELAKFHEHWRRTLSFGEHYSANHSGTSIFKYSPVPTDTERRDWKAIEKAAREMNRAMEILLKDIRIRFVEIDITELSAIAKRDLIADEERFEQRRAKRGSLSST
ncbi:MAG: nucleotide-binding protein [Bryobacterales bacterium]|nr:nucleotide-binding protein [Bryobacterales bacterium]